MINLSKARRMIISVMLVVASVIFPSFSFAGQEDINLIQSYIGEWKGRGTVSINTRNENISCRLKVTKKSFLETVRLDARCFFSSGFNIKLKGNIGYFQKYIKYIVHLNANLIDKDRTLVGERDGLDIDFNFINIDIPRGYFYDAFTPSGRNITLANDDKTNDTSLMMQGGVGMVINNLVFNFTIIDENGLKTTVYVPFERES